MAPPAIVESSTAAHRRERRPCAVDRRSQDRAQRQTLGYLVQEQRRRNSRPRARRVRAHLHRDQPPPVHESVDRGGGQQRPGKSVKRFRAALMAMIVRATGANGKCESVENLQQDVSR